MTCRRRNRNNVNVIFYHQRDVEMSATASAKISYVVLLAELSVSIKRSACAHRSTVPLCEKSVVFNPRIAEHLLIFILLGFVSFQQTNNVWHYIYSGLYDERIFSISSLWKLLPKTSPFALKHIARISVGSS